MSAFRGYVSSLLISNLTWIYSSTSLSHLLYLVVFVFFSPCLLKLVKFLFLSPLFISNSILFLVLLTTLVNEKDDDASGQSCFKHLSVVYNTLLGKLHPENYCESESYQGFEELEIYRAVFGSSEVEANAPRAEVSEEKTEEDGPPEKKDEPPQGETIHEAAENIQQGGEGHNGTVPARAPESECNNLGAYGSMRMDKEWERTLACKLVDERDNAGGDEGMDSLWETYEIDSSEPKSRDSEKKNCNSNNNSEKKKKKKEEMKEEEEEDGEVGRDLCCLQALKFSSVKMMNLGIGRPNLVRISKAVKGFGWLRHAKKKHSTKVHNNGDN